MGICAASMAVNLTCKFNEIVDEKIETKKKELDEISFSLSNNAKFLRHLRVLQTSKKEVDLTPLESEFGAFRAQFEKIQDQMDAEFKSTFDFNKVDLKKVSLEVLEDLIGEVENSKTFLENRIQPDIMEIEAQIQLMRLLCEITKIIVQEDSRCKNGILNRAGK